MTELIPTLQDLKHRLYLAFQGNSDLPEFADERITSRALAGLFHELYLKNAATAKNIFPDQADDRAVFNHARVRAKERRPATTASGPVIFSISQDLNISNAILQDSNGYKYRILDHHQLSTDDTASLKAFVEALEPGKKYNRLKGTKLTPVRSVAGLRHADVIGDGITGGTDTGSLEQLRLDVIKSFQSYEGRGGNDDDWLKWLRSIPSSFRSFYFPRFGGPGNIGYAFVVRLPDETVGIPNELQTEQAETYLRGKKPCLATLIKAGVRLTPVAFSIDANFTDQQEQDVVNNLKHLFLEKAHISSAHGDMTGEITRNDMITTIRTAAGTSNFRLVTPSGDLIPGNLEIFKYGQLEMTGSPLESE